MTSTCWRSWSGMSAAGMRSGTSGSDPASIRAAGFVKAGDFEGVESAGVEKEFIDRAAPVAETPLLAEAGMAGVLGGGWIEEISERCTPEAQRHGVVQHRPAHFLGIHVMDHCPT